MRGAFSAFLSPCGLVSIAIFTSRSFDLFQQEYVPVAAVQNWLP